MANILLETWPTEVADADRQRDPRRAAPARAAIVLTFGVAFAIYFASSGIESLRIGLNRAYGLAEAAIWWMLRLESIGYVLVGAVALLVLAFLVVLAPLIFATAVRYVPLLEPLWLMFNFRALCGRRDRADRAH